MILVRCPGLLLAAACVAAGSAVSGAQAATVTAQAAVKVVKPLELRGVQDLNFGQVVMVNVVGTATVSISPAGALTCGSGLTCAGTVLPAIYNVRGTNNQVVNIFARSSNLTNAQDGRTITFTPIVQPRITLTSSGAPGNVFNVGGTIAIPATTSDGNYTGAIDITVDYN